MAAAHTSVLKGKSLNIGCICYTCPCITLPFAPILFVLDEPKVREKDGGKFPKSKNKVDKCKFVHVSESVKRKARGTVGVWASERGEQ